MAVWLMYHREDKRNGRYHKDRTTGLVMKEEQDVENKEARESMCLWLS